MPHDPLPVTLRRLSEERVGRDFASLVRGGSPIVCAGTGRDEPRIFLRRRYRPIAVVVHPGGTYYLSRFLAENGFRFLIGYVIPSGEPRLRIYPRIFYKDSSLLWRVASHMIRNEDDDWIGKGTLKWVVEEGKRVRVTDEATTDLPYEIQSALDRVSRRYRKQQDAKAVELVVRNAPNGRIEPYSDFSRPRERAATSAAINGGRPIATVRRELDPASARFAPGFKPDFAAGPLSESSTVSRLYNGRVRKLRFASLNGLVQYQFAVSPTHVWVNPPQAMTAEITSYGVRALHIEADEVIFMPGYEYHEPDSQIPKGFAGPVSPKDPERADASAWIEALPVIQDFRRKFLEG